jgi:small subunit ribosomal protein S13
MPRLLGIDIPGDKRIEAALPYIYGIGPTRAKYILEVAEISPDVRAKTLTDQQLNRIIQIIQENKYVIEGDLRRGLPVRGQRTGTNARTRKGPRKTVGVQRNKDAKAGKV